MDLMVPFSLCDGHFWGKLVRCRMFRFHSKTQDVTSHLGRQRRTKQASAAHHGRVFVSIYYLFIAFYVFYSSTVSEYGFHTSNMTDKWDPWGRFRIRFLPESAMLEMTYRLGKCAGSALGFWQKPGENYFCIPNLLKICLGLNCFWVTLCPFVFYCQVFVPKKEFINFPGKGDLKISSKAWCWSKTFFSQGDDTLRNACVCVCDNGGDDHLVEICW